MAHRENKREFSRSSVWVRSEMRLRSGVLLEGRTRDLSLDGIAVETERPVPVGNSVKMTLLLDGRHEPLRIQAAGEVVRVSDSGVAIRFTHIDADSLEHLKRLVMLNAEDAEQVDREFEAHAGIRRFCE